MTEPVSYTPPELTLVGPDHVRAYRESGGEVGYIWNGVPILLLTVTGRRTGRELTSALIFARDGDDYLVVASMAGAPKHPSWYLNLQAQPTATIQVKDQQIPVVAHTASASDKPRLWQIAANVWPNYDTYQQRTDRDIPVVVLSPR
jgi:deazaflavin-dependent oxidoreductase (nitroreductase family)